MENPRENPLPLPTIRRYPIFLRAIGEMMDAGEAFISSSVLAERLGLDPVLTRKDLAMAGVPGRPRRGYPAEELRAAINRALGWDSATDAVLVGAGSLGSALLGYAGFKEQNLSIVAAFDANPRLAGSTVHGVKVRPLAEMARLVRRLKVHLAILTVPTAAAQAYQVDPRRYCTAHPQTAETNCPSMALLGFAAGALGSAKRVTAVDPKDATRRGRS